MADPASLYRRGYEHFNHGDLESALADFQVSTSTKPGPDLR